MDNVIKEFFTGAVTRAEIEAAALAGEDLAARWGTHVSPRRLALGEIRDEGSAYGRIWRVGVDVAPDDGDDWWRGGKRPAVAIPAEIVAGWWRP